MTARPTRTAPFTSTSVHRAGLGALLAAALVLSGCGTPAEPGAEGDPPATGSTVQPGAAPGERSPVLLIGVDGLEWGIVAEMLREGRLPHLAELIESGVHGKLATLKPTVSPSIWTTVITGTVPDKHGIHGFVDKGERGRGRRGSAESDDLYRSVDRRQKALWNIVSEADLRVGVVGWWLTFPVEPVNGVMVAQVNTLPGDVEEGDAGIWKGALYADMPGQVYPPGRQEELLALVPGVLEDLDAVVRDTYGDLDFSIDPAAEALWERCTWAFRADETYRRVARAVLADDGFDLFAVYFGSPDVVGHRFWRYREPGAYANPPTGEQVAMFGDVIRDAYAHVDRVIGEMIEAFDDRANVVVLSDHGMHSVLHDASFDPKVDTEGVARLRSGGHNSAPPGFFVARGPAFRQGSGVDAASLDEADVPRIGSVLDLAPTLLAVLGLPVGEDMDGTVLTEALTAEHLRRFPVRRIATHTPEGWSVGADVSVDESDAAREERLKQLRSLGYLGD